MSYIPLEIVRTVLRVLKLLFASSAAAIACVIVAIVMSVVVGWSDVPPWIGDHFPVVVLGLFLVTFPVMFRWLK
jgi:hypothetical protein